MAGFFLSRAARADLKEIGRYTKEKWGLEQRNRYLAQLYERFRRVGTNPGVGKSYPFGESRS